MRRDYLCDDRHGLLIVLASRESSIALTIDGSVVRRHELGNAREFGTPVRRFVARLRTDSRRISGKGKHLHERALTRLSKQAAAPLLTRDLRMAMSRWEHLTIIDFGAVHGLPWEALSWDEDRLLGERFAVVHSACLPIELARLSRGWPQRVEQAEASLCLRATLAGRAGAGTGGRPAKRLEPRMFRAATRPFGDNVTIELGRAVTIESLTKRPFSATVNHVIAHGAQQFDRERYGGLALAPVVGTDDGFLSCDAIAQLEVSGLVVLSTCNSAVGRPRVGDDTGRTTPGGAFLHAGAATVIHSGASLWLPDQVELAVVLNTELIGGTSPAMAMRTARLQSQGGTSLRFERAQMQVLGLGHLPIVR